APSSLHIDRSPFLENWQFLLRALGTTLLVSGLSTLLGCAIGIVGGTLRTYGVRLCDTVIGLYVDITRSIPVLAILVWMYFAFPLLIEHSLDPIVAAVLALGIHLGAYVTEAIRAGLT